MSTLGNLSTKQSYDRSGAAIRVRTFQKPVLAESLIEALWSLGEANSEHKWVNGGRAGREGEETLSGIRGRCDRRHAHGEGMWDRRMDRLWEPEVRETESVTDVVAVSCAPLWVTFPPASFLSAPTVRSSVASLKSQLQRDSWTKGPSVTNLPEWQVPPVSYHEDFKQGCWMIPSEGGLASPQKHNGSDVSWQWQWQWQWHTQRSPTLVRWGPGLTGKSVGAMAPRKRICLTGEACSIGKVREQTVVDRV